MTAVARCYATLASRLSAALLRHYGSTSLRHVLGSMEAAA